MRIAVVLGVASIAFGAFGAFGGTRAWAAPATSATTPAPPTDARALDLFERSAKAYREGRFDDAVELLLEARRHKPEPVLLYDLGRAYEAQGRLREAADAYAAYLAEEPKAVDAKAIEARVVTLRRMEAERAQRERERAGQVSVRPSVAPAAAVAAPKRDPLAPVPWIVAGAGAITIGTGAAFGILASARHRDADREPVQATAAERQEDAERYARVANIAFIVGGVLAASGVVWLLVRSADGGSVTVTAAPGGASLVGAW